MSKEQVQPNVEKSRSTEIEKLNKALALYLKSVIDTVPLQTKELEENSQRTSIQFDLPNSNCIDYVEFIDWPKSLPPYDEEDVFGFYIQFTSEFKEQINQTALLDRARGNRFTPRVVDGRSFCFRFPSGGATREVPYEPTEYELVDYTLEQLTKNYPNCFPNFHLFEQAYYKGGNKVASRMFRTKGRKKL